MREGKGMEGEGGEGRGGEGLGFEVVETEEKCGSE